MTASPDHDWTQDLKRSFVYIEKAMIKQNVLVVAFLIVNVLTTILKHFNAGFPSLLFEIAAIVIVLFLGASLIREVYASREQDEDFSVNRQPSGTPILSMVLLCVAFWAPALLLGLLLVVPGVWWAGMSCLAVAIVVLEDKGALEAIRRSHQLVKGRITEVLLFMLPPAILFIGGVPGFGKLSDYGLEYLAEQGYPPPVQLAGVLITGILFSAIWLLSNLLIFAYLAQLFIRLTGKQDSLPPA
jgi:hypothetical protein